MRLSDVLSKPLIDEYVQIEGCLVNKSGKIGQKVDLDIGTIALNYFCENCGDVRTFYSKGKLSCIFVNKRLISIDCVLSCICDSTVQIWFLVESDGDITSVAPRVRILKKMEKLSSKVRKSNPIYQGKFSIYLNKADRAFQEGLGAGSIIYLRKIYELIAIEAADASGIDKKDNRGNGKRFKTLLKEVDRKWSIIPRQFSENQYKLFEELSNVIHGDYDEEIALNKYVSLRKLISGVLDNTIKNIDYAREIKKLGWNNEGVESK